jgi:AraC-like DNA-binding protein
MRRSQRIAFAPEGVPVIETVGHDARPGVIPLFDHAHTGVEICYIASGEVTWRMGARRLRLVGGMISVIQPGIAHCGEMNVIAPSDLYWIVIVPTKIRPALSPEIARVLASGEPYAAKVGADVQALFDTAMQECTAHAPGWQNALTAIATRIAVEAARACPQRQGKKSAATPQPVLKACKIIRENLEFPPSMRELARQVKLGPTRFHALFRETIGLTPLDYVVRLRLAEACRALAETDENITDMALRLGFPSSQYFATVFKKHNGVSPTAFRTSAAKPDAPK